jgi:RNA polymerase sigma-70 factor, ECF subfamily
MQEDARRQIFQSAVEQFSDSCYRVAYRLTSNHELALELVQETFMAAWRNLGQLQEPERLRSWLFGILRNQFSKQLARESRNRHQILDCEPIVSNDTSRVAGDVQEAVSQLEENQRLAILLVSMEGWTVEEAAEFLSVPRGTVLSRLHRARQRLRVLLTPDWESSIQNL